MYIKKYNIHTIHLYVYIYSFYKHDILELLILYTYTFYKHDILELLIYVLGIDSGSQPLHARQGSTTMENFQRMELPTLYRMHWHLLLKKLFYLVKCLEKKMTFSLDKAFCWI